MRKGFGAVFFVIAAFFIAAPIAYFAAVSRNNENVKGASSLGYSKGFYVTVNSSGGTWDLHQYGCSEYSVCAESLFSGDKISVISGGAINSHDLAFTSSPVDSKFGYVKFFIEPGWGSIQRTFSIDSNLLGGVREEQFSEGSRTINALIVPVSAYNADYFQAAEFSD